MSAVSVPEGPDAGAIWHYGDPLGEQRAAETDAVLVDRSHRRVLTLTGADRQTWLHSISTQHVSELPDGASTQNLSLDGQGRVEDHWIQTELGGITYLDTEPWRGRPGPKPPGTNPNGAALPPSTPNRGGASRCWTTCARWCSGQMWPPTRP